MITSQDLRAKSFEKAVFGGYDMASVDEYLETLAQTLDSNMREISTLKSKMKILANKVEEYRKTDEAMRLALVSAQQLAAQIEAEAKQKAEAIITEATAQSLEGLSDLKKQTANEEARLAAAKAAFTLYVGDARKLCQDHLRALDEIPEDMYGEIAPECVRIEADEPEQTEEIPETVNDDDVLIAEPAQPADDFESTLLFSLD